MNTLRRSLSSRARRTEARLFQPVHHAGDGARGQARHLGEPARRDATLEVEKIQAFQIGTRNAGRAGNGLPENHPWAEERRIACSSSCISAVRAFGLDIGDFIS